MLGRFAPGFSTGLAGKLPALTQCDAASRFGGPGSDAGSGEPVPDTVGGVPAPDSVCILIVTSGGACGGMPFARTMAQCHSWSGKRAKFNGVRNVAVVDGAADPFTCSSM